MDRARRTGFCGAGRSSVLVAVVLVAGSTLTERSRTICSSEGVTMGRLASSLATGLLLLRGTGSFLVSARRPLATFLRGRGAGAESMGRGGGGGGTVASGADTAGAGGCDAAAVGVCCWLREDTVDEEEEEEAASGLGAAFCPDTAAVAASGRLQK